MPAWLHGRDICPSRGPRCEPSGRRCARCQRAYVTVRAIPCRSRVCIPGPQWIMAAQRATCLPSSHGPRRRHLWSSPQRGSWVLTGMFLGTERKPDEPRAPGLRWVWLIHTRSRALGPCRRRSAVGLDMRVLTGRATLVGKPKVRHRVRNGHVTLELVQTTKKTLVSDQGLRNGASDGNRTRALSLGSSCSTIKLHSRSDLPGGNRTRSLYRIPEPGPSVSVSLGPCRPAGRTPRGSAGHLRSPRVAVRGTFRTGVRFAVAVVVDPVVPGWDPAAGCGC